ncbi:MAG: NitT/TauT family transport system substrate-binding protein [Caballeronia sp.]|nr:NitT/TauT family transport system substrate-binding protein [Caballeronia sp.]
MNPKSLLAIAAVGILTPLLLGGCDSKQPATSARTPLRIAGYYWAGSFWVDVANEKGWFKEAGLAVAIVDTNQDYFASFADLVEGRLDVDDLTLFDVMLLNAKGGDLVGIATTDQSAGADGIVARAGIDTLAALKGKRIGGGKGTYVEYLLSIVLGREGLAMSDITLVDMPGEKAHERLAAGDVDAVVTWEPALTEAVEKAHGHKLWDSTIIPGLSPSLLTTRASVARERPEDLQKLLGVWQRGSEFIQQHPEEAFTIVARVNKKTLAEVRQFAAGVRLLDRRANLVAFSYGAGFDSLHGSARMMNDFLVKEKLAPKPIDSIALLNDSFLKAMK